MDATATRFTADMCQCNAVTAVVAAYLPRCLVGLLAQLVFAPFPANPAEKRHKQHTE